MSATPLVVDLDGQRVVCVGAGPVAAAKALPLLEAGADLVLVAPEACPELRTAGLTWHQRAYEPGDLDGAILAIAATGSARVNDQVAREAAVGRVLCVRTDGGGTAAFPAVVRRGPLLLAVSTSGQAPALARRVRERLEEEYGREWGELATLLGELRAAQGVTAALQGIDHAERRRRWHAVLDAMLADGRPNADRHTALAALGAAPEQSPP